MGICVRKKRVIIVPDLGMSTFHNSNVDLDTLLPVICLPLLAPGKE